MSFVEKLKESMKVRKMNAADLARATGLSTAAISDYLNGKKEPRTRQSISIAKALNISLDELWETEFSVNNDYQIQASEYQLIAQYRGLDDAGKETISYLLAKELERVNQLKSLTTPSYTKTDDPIYNFAAEKGLKDSIENREITKNITEFLEKERDDSCKNTTYSDLNDIL